MPLAALLVMLAGALTGLVVGLIGGPEAGAIGALAAAGFVAGLHLHRVVADQYAPR